MGVPRQYSGTLGKVGNCQIAVSVHAATTRASGVLDWRLYLGASWDEDRLPAASTATAHADGDSAARQAARRRVSKALKSGRTVTAATAAAAGTGGISAAERAQLSDMITARRDRAKIPATERHRPKWQLGLEMIDELLGWGHTPPVVVGDAGYGQADFRTALRRTHLRRLAPPRHPRQRRPTLPHPIRLTNPKADGQT